MESVNLAQGILDNATSTMANLKVLMTAMQSNTEKGQRETVETLEALMKALQQRDPESRKNSLERLKNRSLKAPEELPPGFERR